jgi:hypothetical protein
MKFIRIVAKYNDDKRQTMTLIGRWDKNHQIHSNIEMFGKIKDWSDEDATYLDYPFFTENAGSNELFICYGGYGDNAKDKIDILGRRIAEGESILRTEIENNNITCYQYVIASIHEY